MSPKKVIKPSCKSVSEMSEKHFSRYGEFLVSFELSKYGWNVYEPVYDEYIDFIVHKYVCEKCGSIWNHTPQLHCKKCGKDYSKIEKHKIIARKICKECGKIMEGGRTKCQHCGAKELINMPTCYECDGEIEMTLHQCSCGSKKYIAKFRTIQVKSSRIEFDDKTKKSKCTYAIDMKPKDLINDGLHFFIWCLINDNNHASFLVISVKEFIETMGNSMKGISFFKDQDRQHFSSKDFGKWREFFWTPDNDVFQKLE